MIAKGAEAELYEADWFGLRAVLKIRRPKPYRDPQLDAAIRRRRTINEVRLMARAREAGVSTPAVYFFDLEECLIAMEFVEGPTAKALLESGRVDVLKDVGRRVALLHRAGIVHGDLALTNVIYRGGEPYFIDFGLGQVVEGGGRRAALEFGRDVNVLLRILDTYGAAAEKYRAAFWEGYREVAGARADDVETAVRKIRASARYVER